MRKKFPDTDELFLHKLEEHCFKKDKDIPAFSNLIFEHIRMVENAGIGLDEFDLIFEQKLAEKAYYDKLAMEAKRNREVELRMYKTTHEELERFRQLGLVHKRNFELEKEDKRKDKIIEEKNLKIENLQKMLDKYENERSCDGE